MASSQFSVTKSGGSFVVPCESTPSHDAPLSSIDMILGLGTFAEVLMVYKYGQEPAKVIREALGKALVPYYPLAGRLVGSEEGELQVACTGDGVWFVEASADCSLEDIQWVKYPSLMEELLPFPPNPVGMLLMMQVTRFTCGGFIVGVMFNHMVVDGIGIAQILNAVAEIARGLNKPTIDPVWSRNHFPIPSRRPRTRGPLLVPHIPLDHFTIDLSLDHINQLKTQFMQRTGKRCSTFDVAAAKLWQCRTRAIGVATGVDIHLQFMANTRHLVKHVQKGYYGNCVYPAIVTAPSDTIAHASLVEIVTLITEAKRRVAVDFFRWVKGEDDEKLAAITMGYESLIVSDWTQLGLGEVDYGWGAPTYVTSGPWQRFLRLRPWCVVVKPSAPLQLQGLRLITRCVKHEHLEAFRDQMNNLSTNIISPKM